MGLCKLRDRNGTDMPITNLWWFSCQVGGTGQAHPEAAAGVVPEIRQLPASPARAGERPVAGSVPGGCEGAMTAAAAQEGYSTASMADGSVRSITRPSASLASRHSATSMAVMMAAGRTTGTIEVTK